MSRARFRALAVAAALLAISACSGPASDGSIDRTSLSADESAQMRRGELLALACLACHALTPSGGPDIGPSLYGVFGRRAASLPEFEYSDALRAAQFEWTPERLDAWLQAPTLFLPGTTMVFAGYGDQHDRAALIEWLRAATAPVGE